MAFAQADVVVEALAQVADHGRLQGNGGVGLAIATGHIGTDADQVTALLITRPELLEILGATHVLGRDHRGHDPADGRFDVDGRVVSLLGQASGQHDVAVEHTPRRVGDRVLLVVAFRQYGIERRDRTAARLGIARALHQFRQLGEYRGWITLGRWRLADGQGDFPLGLGKTGQRVHQQQDVLALVAKIFGDARAVHRRAHPHQRRIVGRRSHHHRTLEAFFAEDVLDELLDLPAPLTDQPDHNDVGFGKAGHHAQQHTLAHAGTGEQAQALAATDREQAVDRPNADVQRHADGVAVERVDGRAVHRHPVLGLHPALAVQRPTGTVEHPPEHAHAHRQAAIVRQRHDPRARSDPGDAAHRHQEYFVAGKPHDLGFDFDRVIAVVVDHPAAAAHGGAQTFSLERQADHAQQAPFKDRLAWQLNRGGVAAQALGKTGAIKAHLG